MVSMVKLSPSRANDFQNCPLLFRFRTIDQLPEPLSIDAVRGTIVHTTLENLYDLPAIERQLPQAYELWREAFAEISQNDKYRELFDAIEDISVWSNESLFLLDKYFALEEPVLLEPTERESHIEFDLQDGFKIHGYVDRIDVAPSGEIRIVDYKTGKSPREGYEQKAFFQLRFYALIIWRTRNIVPRKLRLIYLGDGRILEDSPTENDLIATEKKIVAIWKAMEAAFDSKNFPPKKSKLCDWCAHQSLCPEFGGTPPPLPLP
ncbi:unannotated protein [freshwater metagenome]|uniref:Unannotated protein n=1 Tax=freshwater metagenome TaxID=449393 RepID=A0A6J7TL78_9ZZZZ|nr:Dna2/Cas4 domain-containing protein [Actinomycetota bacterium]